MRSSFPPNTYSPAPIATWCALLPIVAVHASYLISASNGQVEWCVPYWDSCTSISRAGRQHPAAILFKTMVICAGVLMLAYWLLLVNWLHQQGESSHRALLLLRAMGIYAGIAVLLYSATLGHGEDYLRGLRRIGITLFFALTAFGHLTFVYRLQKLPKRWAAGLQRYFLVQRNISYLLVIMGLISGLLSAFYDDYKQIDDAIEWCFALPMILQFWLTGRMWRESRYQIQLSLEPS